jgi:maltose O-acetyltransferase
VRDGSTFRAVTVGGNVRRGLVNTIGAAQLTPPVLRHRLLRWCGVRMGAGVVVRAGYFLDNTDVAIGSGSFINAGCHFDGRGAIRIGAECDIGMDVLFCTSTHGIGGPNRRAGQPTDIPVVVGDGCWIGTRVTLLPGVTVAPGCVVAAGAVVTRSTLPNGLYAGVPAVLVRELGGADVSAAASSRHVQGTVLPS